MVGTGEHPDDASSPDGDEVAVRAFQGVMACAAGYIKGSDLITIESEEQAAMFASEQANRRTVVGVSLHPDELAELDRQCRKLGIDARAAALKLVWQHFGDDAVTAAQQRAAGADAEAADLTVVLAPLVDAMRSLDTAWVKRANQRQRIGVLANQIAKLANVERLRVRDGGQVSDETVETLALALAGMQRTLDAQAEAEREDDRLRGEVRQLLDQLRGAP